MATSKKEPQKESPKSREKSREAKTGGTEDRKTKAAVQTGIYLLVLVGIAILANVIAGLVDPLDQSLWLARPDGWAAAPPHRSASAA